MGMPKGRRYEGAEKVLKIDDLFLGKLVSTKIGDYFSSGSDDFLSQG